jgi:uncharacterized protein with HEPN domain
LAQAAKPALFTPRRTKEESLAMRLDTLGSLLDIQNDARFIVDATAGMTFADFLADRMVRDAVARSFTKIGASTGRMQRHDRTTTARISGAEEFVELRDLLIYRYDEDHNERVWVAIREHVPVLVQEAGMLLEEGERELARDPT